MHDNSEYIVSIKNKAAELGFGACGVSPARRLEKEARRLEKWLSAGMHGSMKFMENYFEKRVDPRKLVDDAKTVISLLLNYYPSRKQEDPGAPVLSKYAYGADYHYVMKDKLKELLGFMNETIGEVNGRAFVDSAPVLDRAWAARSGIGWIGKNSCLITGGAGSFFFIGELIVDIELPADAPAKDHCGSCRICIDACPTGAIVEPGLVDARRCISYLTIEYRDEFPAGTGSKLHNRVFGCDLCQDVCPWNRKANPHHEPLFEPESGLLELTTDEWYEMAGPFYRRLFSKSAVKRAGYRQLRRNLDALRGVTRQ
ncbi:MAG: tRNA epoxyqueuosine(34) reductase QueG [Marinilabiliales bacterium]|nr:MAG: tRNA epoxyqueuosine(34) reductase QueG [Marinilabiliales bacterium]